MSDTREDVLGSSTPQIVGSDTETFWALLGRRA